MLEKMGLKHTVVSQCSGWIQPVTVQSPTSPPNSMIKRDVCPCPVERGSWLWLKEISAAVGEKGTATSCVNV